MTCDLLIGLPVRRGRNDWVTLNRMEEHFVLRGRSIMYPTLTVRPVTSITGG